MNPILTKGMKKFCIINQKGGTGKTVTSINLSGGLAREGKKTLLIDMDPQGHSTIGIGIDPVELKASMYDVLASRAPLKEIIVPSYIAGLDVAPSHIKLASGAEQLYSRMFRESILFQTLRSFDELYDFIVIDCPPALGVLTVNALYASDFIVVPCQMSRYSLDGLADLLETIGAIKTENQSSQEGFKHLGILLTMFDKRNKVTNEFILSQLESHKERMFETVIMKNEALNQASIAQKVIFDFEPNSQGASDYTKLTQEILRDE